MWLRCSVRRGGCTDWTVIDHMTVRGGVCGGLGTKTPEGSRSAGLQKVINKNKTKQKTFFTFWLGGARPIPLEFLISYISQIQNLLLPGVFLQRKNAPKTRFRPPRLGAYDAPPATWGGGHPLPIPLPLDAFGVSMERPAPPTFMVKFTPLQIRHAHDGF